MWEPGYPLRERAVDRSMLVGEWTCPETVVGPGPEERANHYEIWLQRSGSRGVHVGPARVVGNATNAVFVSAGEVVRPSYPRRERQQSTVIMLDRVLVGALLSEVDERAAEQATPLFPAASVMLSPGGALLHHSLLREAHTGAAPSLQTEETALILLRLLFSHASQARTPHNAPRRARRSAAELVESVQHLLARRYSEKLTLEEIGKTVGVSPFHLTRTFSGEVGMPLHRYLRSLRLRVALDLMSQRPHDLSWVALETGFASHSHFTAAFGAEYGVPPSLVARKP